MVAIINPFDAGGYSLAEMTEALGRGWEGRDSRSAMVLQNERAGIEVKADPAAVRAVMQRE